VNVSATRELFCLAADAAATIPSGGGGNKWQEPSRAFIAWQITSALSLPSRRRMSSGAYDARSASHPVRTAPAGNRRHAVSSSAVTELLCTTASCSTIATATTQNAHVLGLDASHVASARIANV
jgi:hypothetical protein